MEIPGFAGLGIGDLTGTDMIIECRYHARSFSEDPGEIVIGLSLGPGLV